MKRGFLLRAGEKAQAAQPMGARKQIVPLTSWKSASEQGANVDTPLVEELLPSGDLSVEEKALPSDYHKVSPILEVSDPYKTQFSDDRRVITTIPQPSPGDEPQCEWLVNGSTKAKVLNALGYPARIPKPTRPDLYQVRSTPEMGDGLFAQCNIKRGDIILAERPLLVTPAWIGICGQNDHYTKLQMQQILMSEFETWLECTISRLPSQSQADYRALHNSHTGDWSGPLLGIMRSNSYEIGNLYDGPDNAPTCPYAAVCKIGSRINHSCIPNVRCYFKINSFSLQFYAIRDIKTGEQLFYSYCPANGNLATRRANLATYGFICKCPACVNATPATDELRTIYVDLSELLMNVAMNSSTVNDTTLKIALRLEEEMIKEGLDTSHRFGGVLKSISLVYRKLGKLEESEKYSVRAGAFRKYWKKDE